MSSRKVKISIKRCFGLPIGTGSMEGAIRRVTILRLKDLQSIADGRRYRTDPIPNKIEPVLILLSATT